MPRLLRLLITFLTVVATVLLVTGFIPDHWLTKKFVITIPSNKYMDVFPYVVFALLPKSQISNINALDPLDLHIDSHMGLYENCKTQHGELAGKTLNDETCDSEGAADWQKAAFFLAGGSLVSAVMTSVFTFLSITHKKYINSAATSFVLVGLNFVTGVLALIPVVFYAMFKRIKVNKDLPDMIDFDLDWAIYVMFGGSCLFGLLVVLNAFNLLVIHKTSAMADDGDSIYEMDKKGKAGDNSYNF